MFAKFDLSVLNSRVPKRKIDNIIPSMESVDAEEKEKDKNEEEVKLTRYSLSRLICKVLNDYSDEPKFIKEDINFSSLKGLTEDDWEDVIKKLEKELKDKHDVDVEISTDFDWTKEEDRDVKAFVDEVWSLIEEDDEEEKSESSDEKDDKDDTEDDSDDDEEENEEKAEEAYHTILVSGSKYPITPWDSSAFQEELRQLRMIHNYLRNLDSVSNEGVGTGLLKMFIAVTDTFLRVGNTFKTNVFKFYKSLKRSEMRYYFESHMTMCLKVESLPITDVSSIQIPIPSGMKGTYQNAILSMEQVYSVLDMESFAKGVLAAMIDLRRKLMRSEPYKDVLVPMENIMNQRVNSIKQLKGAMDKVFTSQKTPPDTKFIDVYKSMKEFKDVRVSLLDMEKYLADVNKMVNMVDDTNTVLADITSYLSEDSEVDKPMITSLINIVNYLATSYDVYGATTTHQMTVEHNHIGSIGRLWASMS